MIDVSVILNFALYTSEMTMIIGMLGTAISILEKPYKMTLFNREDVNRTGNQIINIPFRLNKKYTVEVLIGFTPNNPEHWYVTDFFPGSWSETSGPRHLSSRTGITKTELDEGNYVLVYEKNTPTFISVLTINAYTKIPINSQITKNKEFFHVLISLGIASAALILQLISLMSGK